MMLDNLYKTRLANGLQVILKETHVAPVASFWIYYRVGSRNELPGKTGISHWVEHMLFKGTGQFPRGEFDKAVARAGGVFNGMTSQDWTTYFETFPSDRIELALQVESDRMTNAVFDAAETESERTVIISEREGGENSFLWLLNEEVQAMAYRLHSYHHPIIGWKNDLLQITRDDLYTHYRTYYAPNNAVVTIVGNFETQAMMERIEHYFGPLPSGPAVPAVCLEEPDQKAERRVLLRGDDRIAYHMQVFHVPAAQHADFFPLVVLDAVLGGAKGMGLFGDGGSHRSSRLYKALVDSELAVAAGSSYRPTVNRISSAFTSPWRPVSRTHKSNKQFGPKLKRSKTTACDPPSWKRPLNRPRRNLPTAARASPIKPIGSALVKSSPALNGSTNGWRV